LVVAAAQAVNKVMVKTLESNSAFMATVVKQVMKAIAQKQVTSGFGFDESNLLQGSVFAQIWRGFCS
jgi:hypothetical protein